ncbi:MAG: hypothetical protein ACR2PO_08175 [Methyloligellaceae bacterium]
MSRIKLTRKERRALYKLVEAGGTCREHQLAATYASKFSAHGLVSTDWAFSNCAQYRLTLHGQTEVLRQRFSKSAVLAHLGLDVFTRWHWPVPATRRA